MSLLPPLHKSDYNPEELMTELMESNGGIFGETGNQGNGSRT